MRVAAQAVRKVDLESKQSQAQTAKKRNPMEDLKREIMIMQKMKHLNIVTLSEVRLKVTLAATLLVCHARQQCSPRHQKQSKA
jgi:hypothetical protein